MSEQTRHSVDPKFVINRQGKDMVLYAGLVDAAHRAGLIGINTLVVQFPAKENDHTIIVQATAYLPGPDGHRAFSGIGDANPQNVGKNIAPHFIRMAETRAKARALRDALNVGMVTVEELGDDDGNAASQSRPTPAPRPAPQPRPTPAQRPQDAPNAPKQAVPPAPLTEGQEHAWAAIRDMATNNPRSDYRAIREEAFKLHAAATAGQWATVCDRMKRLQQEYYPDTVTAIAQQEG